MCQHLVEVLIEQLVGGKSWQKKTSIDPKKKAAPSGNAAPSLRKHTSLCLPKVSVCGWDFYNDALWSR